MSELKPCRKAQEMTDRILKMFSEEGMTFEEIADVPAELERKINKNISHLKRETVFKLPR